MDGAGALLPMRLKKTGPHRGVNATQKVRAGIRLQIAAGAVQD
jgi:hypothetical protein